MNIIEDIEISEDSEFDDIASQHTFTQPRFKTLYEIDDNSVYRIDEASKTLYLHKLIISRYSCVSKDHRYYFLLSDQDILDGYNSCRKPYYPRENMPVLSLTKKVILLLIDYSPEMAAPVMHSCKSYSYEQGFNPHKLVNAILLARTNDEPMLWCSMNHEYSDFAGTDSSNFYVFNDEKGILESVQYPETLTTVAKDRGYRYLKNRKNEYFSQSLDDEVDAELMKVATREKELSCLLYVGNARKRVFITYDENDVFLVYISFEDLLTQQEPLTRTKKLFDASVDCKHFDGSFYLYEHEGDMYVIYSELAVHTNPSRPTKDNDIVVVYKMNIDVPAELDTVSCVSEHIRCIIEVADSVNYLGARSSNVIKPKDRRSVYLDNREHIQRTMDPMERNMLNILDIDREDIDSGWVLHPISPHKAMPHTFKVCSTTLIPGRITGNKHHPWAIYRGFVMTYAPAHLITRSHYVKYPKDLLSYHARVIAYNPALPDYNCNSSPWRQHVVRSVFSQFLYDVDSIMNTEYGTIRSSHEELVEKKLNTQK